MARVLWMSDAPTLLTGFGLVTGKVCGGLAALGHEVRVLGWWKTSPAPCHGLDVYACPVHPRLAAETVLPHADRCRSHCLVTLGDIPWLSYLAADDVREALCQRGTRWVLHYPVDGTLPDGRLPGSWIRTLSKADRAVTMSRFGLAASAASGIAAI